MVGDEDHGALLDRDRDSLRRRLRPLLQGLHLLPPLTLRAVTNEGDVFVVEQSVDRLEELRASSLEPHTFYFLGTAEVLPLMDASVDEIVSEFEDLTADAVCEFFRVLRGGGTIRVAGPSSTVLNSERMLSEAGFTHVAATPAGGGSLTARKP